FALHDALPIYGRRDPDSELRKLTHRDRLATDLDHPGTASRCLSGDSGDLLALLFPVEIRDAAGDEVAGKRPGIQWRRVGYLPIHSFAVTLAIVIVASCLAHSH